nr:MAG TPA: hypothetical protein [Caudoviricetes sp.]
MLHFISPSYSRSLSTTFIIKTHRTFHACFFKEDKSNRLREN